MSKRNREKLTEYMSGSLSSLGAWRRFRVGSWSAWRWILVYLSATAVSAEGAEFVEDFEGERLSRDGEALAGWDYRTGDGEAEMTFLQDDGVGIMRVDPTKDQRNIWWAIIRRGVSGHINQEALLQPNRELRLEAKIRVSHAPRRVNLHFNHGRTSDFHSFLMEYDIPDTENWHVISLTTESFDARPDDQIFAQMAMMDWGLEPCYVEVDYFRVSIVDPRESGPDLGSPIPYRPEPRSLQSLSVGKPSLEDATIDSRYPQINFKNWHAGGDPQRRPLFSVSGTQTALLRWDLSAFSRSEADGWGVLELTTQSVHWAETELEEFGELRVVEVLGGDAAWNRSTVSLGSFLASSSLAEVLNGQMVIDVPPSLTDGSKTLITISPPVLERLFSGRTKGLAIYPQGALNATFYSNEAGDELAPKLYFNVKERTSGE